MCNAERGPGRIPAKPEIKTKAGLLSAELVSFKIDHPVLLRILFHYIKLNAALNFLGHT